jgi:hypothetical protein
MADPNAGNPPLAQPDVPTTVTAVITTAEVFPPSISAGESRPPLPPLNENETSQLITPQNGTSLMQLTPAPSGDSSTDTTTTSNHARKDSSTGSLTPTVTTGSLTPTLTARKKPKEPSKGHHKKNTLSTQIPFIPATEETQEPDRIRLGICAMDKKARSKPMAEILSRLDESLFHVVFFGDDVIKNKPIEEWPICDVLIAFYSKGYSLTKAREYVELREPFVLNDLGQQELLKDRRRVYDLLEASGIDVPRHVYLSRDEYVSTGTGDGNGSRDREVTEFDDHIEVNGVIINKPFVEKPVDADDHNIAIYYQSSAGGGCKKLFRKIGNRSSEFYPGTCVWFCLLVLILLFGETVETSRRSRIKKKPSLSSLL